MTFYPLNSGLLIGPRPPPSVCKCMCVFALRFLFFFFSCSLKVLSLLTFFFVFFWRLALHVNHPPPTTTSLRHLRGGVETALHTAACSDNSVSDSRISNKRVKKRKTLGVDGCCHERRRRGSKSSFILLAVCFALIKETHISNCELFSLFFLNLEAAFIPSEDFPACQNLTEHLVSPPTDELRVTDRAGG